MTKLSPLFIILLLVFLSIGVVAQSSTDAATQSDQSTSQTDGTSSDSGTTDGTSTDDPTSATSDPGTSSPTPESTTTTTTTTQEPTTTTTTTTDAPPTTTTSAEPSPTTSQPPQTNPGTPAPVTTTDPVAQVTSVIASQPSGLSSIFIPPSSSIASTSSSFIASAASTSALQPLPTSTNTTTSCSAINTTCPTGQYCNASNQTCQAVLADGTACSSADMCLSGVCSNSICGQSSSSSSSSSSSGSTGKIAGIVLGSVGGVGCAVGALFCVRRRNRRHQIQRMRGFTPSMALNGHLNDKSMGNFKKMNNAERHKSDYSFTSEQAALESLSSMSMSMSPIGRQSAVYYKDNQLHSLSGTMSPFEDGDATSYTSSQPVMMASVPLAAYKNGTRSSKFDFLQNAFANRQPIHTSAKTTSPLASKSPPSIASSVRMSGMSSVNGDNWEALISQPPSRSGFVDSERRGSNRMSTTTFGSGHHHVGIGDDESVADPIFSPATSHASARVVMPNQPPPPSHNPFRTYTPSNVPQDAWTKEDEDGMRNYQYF